MQREFMKDYTPVYHKFMEDYKGYMCPRPDLRNVQRQQECVGWNPEKKVPGEHMHG
jgi:hypothetical protein